MPRRPFRQSPGQSLLAYAGIRDRIMGVELQPGAPLSEYVLAELLGMSRTPVREALKQLEQEGLVRAIPRKGVFVTELSVQDIHEIYQIREALETVAVRIAAEQMSVEEIDRLRSALVAAQEAFSNGDHRTAFDADRQLHSVIIASTQNQRLATFLSTLESQITRLRVLTETNRVRVGESLSEQMAILEAIRDRDPDGAVQAMLHHLHNGRHNAVLMAVPSMAAVQQSGQPRTTSSDGAHRAAK